MANKKAWGHFADKEKKTKNTSNKVEEKSIIVGTFTSTEEDIIDDSGALASSSFDPEYECPFCNRIETNKSELQTHILLDHPSRLKPDDLFDALETFYKLPISYTRKDYEKNPQNKEDINKLPEDVREFMKRFKRSKRDMDLFFKLGLKYTKGCFTVKAKKENN